MTNNDKNDKMTKMTIFSKKECPKKNFTKKSVKNYQKLKKNKMGTDRPTDRQTDIAAYRVA